MPDLKYGHVTLERVDLPLDEPVFVLRGKDALAPAAITAYADMVRAMGHACEDPKMIAHAYEALKAAFFMRDWQGENPMKVRLPK